MLAARPACLPTEGPTHPSRGARGLQCDSRVGGPPRLSLTEGPTTPPEGPRGPRRGLPHRSYSGAQAPRRRPPGRTQWGRWATHTDRAAGRAAPAATEGPTRGAWAAVTAHHLDRTGTAPARHPLSLSLSLRARHLTGQAQHAGHVSQTGRTCTDGAAQKQTAHRSPTQQTACCCVVLRLI